MSALRGELDSLSKEFRQEMTDMRKSLERELRKENREIKKTLDSLNKSFQEMTERFKKTEEQNAALMAANSSLETECGMLRKQVVEYEHRIIQLEQYSRNKNIEIKGVPVVPGESLSELIATIGNVINEHVTDDDLEIYHRVPTKDSSGGNIVVQFLSRSKRDAFLEKAKKKRLSTADLGQEAALPIYVNEHLCPSLKKLLGMTIAKKKEHNWRFCWTKNGKIFVRKAESTRALLIGSPDDLDKIQ